jgi:uncharacterized protein involved in type VI secretion and phage assembly
VRHTGEPSTAERMMDGPSQLCTGERMVDGSGEPWTGERIPCGPGGPFYGVHTGLVVRVDDPDGQGRVKVRLPWATDAGEGYEAWARLATLMAGAGRGSWFIPDVDDEVLVAFEAGHPGRPYVIGALWNGQDPPPEAMDADNTVRTIRTRSGVTIRMSDAAGAESLQLETPGGHRVRLSDGPGTIVVEDASGNTVTLARAGIEVAATTNVTVRASAVEVSAGLVRVDARMARFSGTVQAETVIANAVVAPSPRGPGPIR